MRYKNASSVENFSNTVTNHTRNCMQQSDTKRMNRSTERHIANILQFIMHTILEPPTN